MPDDPRDILKAVGAECGSLSAWMEDDQLDHEDAFTRVSGRVVLETADEVILDLARLVAPLARFLNAERALNDAEIMEGTTHRQTDAHVEADQAYREACAALGLDSFLEDVDA